MAVAIHCTVFTIFALFTLFALLILFSLFVPFKLLYTAQTAFMPSYETVADVPES